MSSLLCPRVSLVALVAVSALACSPAPESSSEGADEASPTEDGDADTTSADTETSSDTGEPPLPGACETPLEPVLLADARLVVDVEGVARDAFGRDVVMRGLNTGNRNKTPPFVPFAVTEDMPLDAFSEAADDFFAVLQGWGMDTVRLPFSWEALEPERDVWDEAYLDRYERMVDSAWAHGQRVILDFHQDVWARNYCGDGFPTWAVADPDAPWHDCPDHDWGFKYVTDPDVRGAFDRFYANEDELVDEFHEMWLKMSERFADHPGVVALEILNEPGWGTANDIQQWKLDVLTPFHDAIIPVLHEAAPDLLVAYDNPGIDGVGLIPDLVHPRPEGDFLIYGPHLYGAGTWGLEQDDPGSSVTDYAEFGRSADVHVLLGEFGFQPEERYGPEWLDKVADALDHERISATMWEYSYNEVLWNYEDFSMVDAAGNERVQLDAWVRPWLRAVAGTEPSFAWDHGAGTGSASFVSDGGVSEVVLPPRLFGAGPSSVEISGEEACFTLDMARGELRVTAPAGVAVDLEFAR